MKKAIKILSVLAIILVVILGILMFSVGHIVEKLVPPSDPTYSACPSPWEKFLCGS